jgi:CDP-diacylglycerol---glycerol-3-phosphate 3-phosphatidyltransferase
MWNLPNVLTLSRLVLTGVFLYLLTLESKPWGHDAALVVLLLAGLTDLLDGWLARRWNICTAFGRMADPLMDKILICGGFIYLFYSNDDLVPFWVVMVVVGRELVVTAMRFYVESLGTKFAATVFGKSKMAVQFATLCYFPVYLGHYTDVPLATHIAHVLVWIMVIVTLLSAVPYAIQAGSLLRKPGADA